MSIITWALALTFLLCYSLLFAIFGLTTLGKGRLWLLVAGIFVPVLWILGAAMNPKMTPEEKLMVVAERRRLGTSTSPIEPLAVQTPLHPGEPGLAHGRFYAGRPG